VPELELIVKTVLLALAASTAALPARAQQPNPPRVPSQLFDAVIRYRSAWMADSARFEACSVSRWTNGRVANASRVLLEGAANEPCVPRRVSPAAQAARHVVVVDSVAATDSVARVLITVRHGEYTHRETFRLTPHRAGGTWGVRDVTLWGAVQSSPPPSHH
jgi:hypothetical protein